MKTHEACTRTSSYTVPSTRDSMKRRPPSSSMSWPAGFHFAAGSVNSGGCSSLARLGSGELAGEGEGGFAEAYSFKSSSHRARRSWRSWFGLLRFRAGAGVLGVHVTFACDNRARAG